jgi:hypothetical protein
MKYFIEITINDVTLSVTRYNSKSVRDKVADTERKNWLRFKDNHNLKAQVTIITYNRYDDDVTIKRNCTYYNVNTDTLSFECSVIEPFDWSGCF